MVPPGRHALRRIRPCRHQYHHLLAHRHYSTTTAETSRPTVLQGDIVKEEHKVHTKFLQQKDQEEIANLKRKSHDLTATIDAVVAPVFKLQELQGEPRLHRKKETRTVHSSLNDILRGVEAVKPKIEEIRKHLNDFELMEYHDPRLAREEEQEAIDSMSVEEKLAYLKLMEYERSQAGAVVENSLKAALKEAVNVGSDNKLDPTLMGPDFGSWDMVERSFALKARKKERPAFEVQEGKEKEGVKKLMWGMAGKADMDVAGSEESGHPPEDIEEEEEVGEAARFARDVRAALAMVRFSRDDVRAHSVFKLCRLLSKASIRRQREIRKLFAARLLLKWTTFADGDPLPLELVASPEKEAERKGHILEFRQTLGDSPAMNIPSPIDKVLEALSHEYGLLVQPGGELRFVRPTRKEASAAGRIPRAEVSTKKLEAAKPGEQEAESQFAADLEAAFAKIPLHLNNTGHSEMRLLRRRLKSAKSRGKRQAAVEAYAAHLLVKWTRLFTSGILRSGSSRSMPTMQDFHFVRSEAQEARWIRWITQQRQKVGVSAFDEVQDEMKQRYGLIIAPDGKTSFNSTKARESTGSDNTEDSKSSADQDNAAPSTESSGQTSAPSTNTYSQPANMAMTQKIADRVNKAANPWADADPKPTEKETKPAQKPKALAGWGDLQASLEAQIKRDAGDKG